MGLFASFYQFYQLNPSKHRQRQQLQLVSVNMPIPSPTSLSTSRFEELCRYIQGQLQHSIERSSNGQEDILVYLNRGNISSSSAFASKDKSWTEPLSLGERIRLLAYVREEVSSAGWRIITCGIERSGSRINLTIKPAAQTTVVIPGPADIWPHIKTHAQLMEVAVEDLAADVADCIIQDGGPTMNFLMQPLPATCRALPMESMVKVGETVRNRLLEKWAVDKFVLIDGPKIHCVLRWKEATSAEDAPEAK